MEIKKSSIVLIIILTISIVLNLFLGYSYMDFNKYKENMETNYNNIVKENDEAKKQLDELKNTSKETITNDNQSKESTEAQNITQNETATVINENKVNDLITFNTNKIKNKSDNITYNGQINGYNLISYSISAQGVPTIRYNDKDISVKGISSNVVDIKCSPIGDGSNAYVVFLMSDKTVFVAKDLMENKDNITANKVENVSNIIKIESVFALKKSGERQTAANTIVAIDNNGYATDLAN